MALPAASIRALFKSRRLVELFFKRIKQHHHLKRFRYVGECVQDANLDHVWVYVVVAIIKKRLNLDASLYTLPQILSVTLFERMPIQQAFPGDAHRITKEIECNQLNLLTI